MADNGVSFLFDLDGTLIDSVYQHVQAWHEALHAAGIELSVWRIHRKIGMSGGLFVDMLRREAGIEITPGVLGKLGKDHAAAYLRLAARVRPLPGAQELLAHLTKMNIPWGIATSGLMATARVNIETLGIDPSRVPIVTRDQVRRAKPIPIFSWLRRSACTRTSSLRSSSVTASGTCLRPDGHGDSVSGCSQEDMGRTNWSVRVQFVSMRIHGICWRI